MPYVIAFLMVSPLFLCWDKGAGSSFLMSHFGYKFLLPLDQLWGIFFHPILWYLLVLQWINFDVEANFLFPSAFLKRIMRQKIISRHPCIWVNDFDEESGDKRDFFAHTCTHTQTSSTLQVSWSPFVPFILYLPIFFIFHFLCSLHSFCPNEFSCFFVS